MGTHDFSSRTKARSRAVDVIYEARIKGLDDPPGLYGLAQERQVQSTAQTPIPPYAAQIVDGVAENLDRIDSALGNYSQGWALDRMPQVDLAILRVACWEILCNDEVDGGTAISEAMKIAREKSTDDSPRFINGLLGRINDLREVLGQAPQTVQTTGEDQPPAPVETQLDSGDSIPEEFRPQQGSGQSQEDNLDTFAEPRKPAGIDILAAIDLDNLQ